jgi:hypothetical protein
MRFFLSERLPLSAGRCGTGLDSKLIELDEFLGYWQLSRAELARLCHCSLDTVDRWFVTGKATSTTNRDS